VAGLPENALGDPGLEETTYFDVTGNSTPDSVPIGSINRARWSGEVEIRKVSVVRVFGTTG